MKKLLSLAGLVLAVCMSSLCYATEVQQNRAQVSGNCEYAAFDAGIEKPVANFQSVNVPVNQFVGYSINQLADLPIIQSDGSSVIPLHCYSVNQSFNYSVTQLFNYYGSTQIFSNTLYGYTGRQRSYKFGNTPVAYIAKTNRQRVEASGLYRYDTFERNGRTACTQQRRCRC